MAKISMFLAMLLMTSALGAAEKAFYVATNGNDAQSGTLESPFRTVAQAQKAIRTMKKNGELKTPVTVYIRGGNYFLDAPLTFTGDDSGTRDCPITCKAYPNETPTLSGGKLITGWKQFEPGVWVADIPEAKGGKWSFLQLYVGGELRSRARTPNEKWFEVAETPGVTKEDPRDRPSDSFVYASGDIDPKWDMSSADAIVYHYWTDSHLPVASVDGKTRTIRFGFKAGKKFWDGYSGAMARYVLENFYAAMDQPGEWFLDKKAGKLYYRTKPGEDMTTIEVIAPYRQELMVVEGDYKSLKPVEYLCFEGLNFCHSNFILPWGEPNNMQGSVSVKAAMLFTGMRNCIFTGCSISDMGGFGMDIFDGCTDNTFSYNKFENIAAGAIRISGIPKDASSQRPGRDQPYLSCNPLTRTGSNRFTDNLISWYGITYPSAMALLLLHSDDNLIAHNEIRYGNKNAISVGFMLSYRRSFAHHNIIEYNYLHDISTNQILSDGGAIYTLGVQPGTVIRNNLIHGVSANRYGGWGIYCDEGSSEILIENNIVYNTLSAGIFVHYGRDITIRNNIFAFGQTEQVSRGKQLEPHETFYFEGNIVYWDEGSLIKMNDGKEYQFYANPGKNGLLTYKNRIIMDYNLYYNPHFKHIDGITMSEEKMTWKKWNELGHDTHSLYADPLFYDVKNHDFRLKPESPAFKLGFREIDMSEVGVRRR